MQTAAVVLALVLDGLAVAIVLFGGWILATGGGTLDVAGVHIRAYTLRNPALSFAVVVCLRALLVERAPRVLAVRGWDLRRLPAAFSRLIEGLREPGPGARRKVLAFVLAVIALSTALKLLNAWSHFGFYSGDDVEIQEMAFSRLFGYAWTAWNLRNAFYPMIFIYPAQAALHAMGVSDTGLLVFAGRAVVAASAGVTVWLVFLAARRQFASAAVGACAVGFLALNRLHVAFASTELPRPVAAAFLTGAYLLVDMGGWLAPTAAGVLLGVAAALRFSEALFLVPALLALAVVRRWRDALLVAVVTTATALVIVGVSDLLYWKEPFFSLRNVVDYTVMKGLSSRGYQSPFHYLTDVNGWTNVLTLGFALIGIRYAPRLALWFVVPLVLLSCLPHKEARYLVPLMPFYAMLAAVGLWKVATHTVGASGVAARPACAVLLAGSVLTLAPLELEGVRFRRSESAVEVARYLAGEAGTIDVAIEDTFRAGSSLYLHGRARLHQLDPVVVRRDPGGVVARLQAEKIDYVALADEDVRGHGYDRLLQEQGFVEIDYGGKTAYEKFRLFRRRR